ncbi:DNA polymerase III subunit alpha [Candidatus Saccharibacteria bacterium]|nr:DNA polymerase III subunit alpha [Candidatus Saccharibacteria bacterium]
MSTKAGVSPLSMSDYVHLHNHSHYSLLDGLSKVPALLDHAKSLGMESIAVTDHGTLSGLIEFYKESIARNMKPLLGIETYIAARKHTDKDASHDKQYYHLILIAMDNTGYQNLMRLSTLANLDGFYYKPRIDRDLLEKYNEGLIVLSACIGGEVGDALRNGQYEQAKSTAEWYKRVFKDRYYLEVQDHGHPKHPTVWDEQVAVNKQIFKLAKELDISCVLTCDAHYLTHAEQEAHEILLCVQTGAYLADSNRMSLANMELHITDPKEIIERWGVSHPEIITNTKAIAERCQVTLELGKILIPQFPVPKGETEMTHLHRLVYQGVAWRYNKISDVESKSMSIKDIKKKFRPDVLKRTEFELGVIDKMGFNGYFLIIWDFINWGKNQGIVFGPGRGSAAGSIVAYSLRITELDPIKYDLLFERFLNPDRISMPDIDIDIQDTRRGEVINYCIEKYGKDKVANIVTFGKMAARNAVRDVARVLQVPYIEADRLAKMIPLPIQGRHILLKTSLQADVDLKNENETNEQSARVFDLATKLEGTIRSHGVHAAGVVIAPDDIVKFVPLEMAQKGVVATQYSMGPIEDLGLLKMDFLGLSNLTIIKNALRIIKKVYKQDIDITEIPLDDKPTYELLSRGDTTGVFQLESAGMKRYLKELKPTIFDDIVAMVALYRPGPMQWIEDFIARKHKQRAIEYLHLAMKPSLENTYGVIVYQEQVMQISKDMCGFTGGQADTLRKAIGKKQVDVMKKMKKDFIDGAVKHSNADPDMMSRLWKQLEDFAAYCFNKSHAACYAMIAYQTAYLKAHYPSAFMAALMTSDYDDTDRLSIEISECKHVGIEVLQPDVNESYLEFAIVPSNDPLHDSIRFGMNAVKNVGTGAVEEILRAREAGKFESLEEIFSRVNPRIVNRKALESLIKAGAFDRFNDRSLLLNNIDNIIGFANRIQKERALGQVDFFGDNGSGQTLQMKVVLDTKGQKFSQRDQLQWERELLGLYLSQHPLKAFEKYLDELSMSIADLKPEMDGKSVVIGGTITEMREITTKSSQKMAFVKIADMYGEIEAVLFPSVYQQTSGIWERDRVVLIRGKLDCKDRQTREPGTEIKLIIDEAREISIEQADAYQTTGKKIKVPSVTKSKPAKPKSRPTVQTATRGRVYIRLIDSSNETQLLSLKTVIDEHKGNTEVVLVLGPADKKQIIKLPGGVESDEIVLEKLRSVVGQTQVVVQ